MVMYGAEHNLQAVTRCTRRKSANANIMSEAVTTHLDWDEQRTGRQDGCARD